MAQSHAPPLAFQAEVVTYERHKRALSPVIDWLLGLVKLAPSYRDTVQGRSFRKQIKAGLLITGILVLVASDGRWVLGIAAAVLMSLAIVLPLPDLRKRSLKAGLKRSKWSMRKVVSQAELRVESKALELHRQDQKIRRVRLTRNHGVQYRTGRTGKPCVGFYPDRNKSEPRKDQMIWVCCSETVQNARSNSPSESHLRQSPGSDSLPVLAEDDFDLMVRLDRTDWDAFNKALHLQPAA